MSGLVDVITIYFLISISIYIIMMERESFSTSMKKKFYAFSVFTVSGILGLVALKYSHLAELTPASSVLLPLFSGLFASPALITSIVEESRIPEQKLSSKLPGVKEVLTGSLSGSLVSIFPGVSSGVAAAISSAGSRKSEQYISTISAANTSNAMLCFAVFLTLGKIRSGAVDAASKFYFEVEALIIAGALTSLAAALLTILSGITASRILPRLNFTLFSSLVLILLTFFIYFLTGWFGLMVYAIATPIGLSTLFLQVRRINCMGCLIIPVILFRAGF
jgi:putative membrane protein